MQRKRKEKNLARIRRSKAAGAGVATWSVVGGLRVTSRVGLSHAKPIQGVPESTINKVLSPTDLCATIHSLLVIPVEPKFGSCLQCMAKRTADQQNASVRVRSRKRAGHQDIGDTFRLRQPNAAPGRSSGLVNTRQLQGKRKLSLSGR